jgi:hypothetical protein
MSTAVEKFWKIYAWALIPMALLYVLGAIIATLNQEVVVVVDLLLWPVFFLIMGLAVVGVFGYAYQKPPRRLLFWRVLFFIVIAAQVVYPLIKLFTLDSDTPLDFQWSPMALARWLFLTVLVIPLYVALYLHAWGRMRGKGDRSIL